MSLILLRTAPVRKMYWHWMKESLTWYQSRRLDHFEKVLLVDCDMTILAKWTIYSSYQHRQDLSIAVGTDRFMVR